MWFIYIIQHNITKQIYIGRTNNLKERLTRHNNQGQSATQRKNGKWIFVYIEIYKSKIDTIEREKRLKHHGRAKQELLKRIKNSLIN